MRILFYFYTYTNIFHGGTMKRGCVKIGEASPYTGLCGCSMEQPYKDNTLIIRGVGMLPGASAEYTSLSMNAQHIKNRAASIFDTAPFSYIVLYPFYLNRQVMVPVWFLSEFAKGENFVSSVALIVLLRMALSPAAAPSPPA